MTGYQLRATIRENRRRITTMRRARSRYHAVPRFAAGAAWRAEYTLDRLQGGTMNTEPVILLHRCRDCDGTWNGIRATWRTDDFPDICNDCQAANDEDDAALERYLAGELDEDQDDDY